MNKKELVDVVAENTGVVKKDLKPVVELVFDKIVEAVLSGEKVSISGFGAFKLVERAERQGRNPKTGEKLVIPARKAVKFAPAKELKEKLKA